MKAKKKLKQLMLIYDELEAKHNRLNAENKQLKAENSKLNQLLKYTAVLN